jgi:hypothetical protein
MSMSLIGKGLEGQRIAATLDRGLIRKPGTLMARLPQQYAPLVYGIIQAPIRRASSKVNCLST